MFQCRLNGTDLAQKSSSYAQDMHYADPNRYRKFEDYKAQHAVHILAVDLGTHRAYTAEQEEDGKPVARMIVYDTVNL